MMSKLNCVWVCSMAAAAAVAEAPWAAAAPAPKVVIPATGRVDMVHDAQRNMLYISTSSGSILRYDVTHNTFAPPLVLGGYLRGIDISPDQNTLVVADGAYGGGTNRIAVIDLPTLTSRSIQFPLQSLEAGTFTTAFVDDGTVLVTSSFAGSGWVPLRKVDLATGAATALASVRQSTMLTPSADRSVVAYAEANTSSGQFGRYRVADGDFRESGTGWFAFEIAANRNGSQFAVPSYAGTFIYDQNLASLGRIGTYADEGPIGVVYSPVSDLVYFAWADWDRTHPVIEAYSTQTLTKVATIDGSGAFDWPGNAAFQQGRLKISRDGTLLFATVSGGVAMYSVPEPSTVVLLAMGAVGLLACSGRRLARIRAR